MSLRDEVTLTISKERFEEFIAPFMDADDDIELSSRPREGDLIFFPLGQRLFEIKFVEHEEPFYQLGSNYVYKLKCELFEYEDEVIDTSIDVIDTQVADDGYIAELKLVGVGRTATATAFVGTGYIREIFLNNDGSGFTGTPTVSISTSPSSLNFSDATAVAFTTSRFLTCKSSIFSGVPPISTTSFVIVSYASKFDAFALRIGLMYNPLCLISRILLSEALNTMEFLGCSESDNLPNRTMSVGWFIPEFFTI